MSQLRLAAANDLPAIQRLLRMGRFTFCNAADEDLPAIVARGATLLAGERDHAWGVLLVDPEQRPATLPTAAPNRAQVRALAMRHGPWLETGSTELVMGLRGLTPAALRPLQVAAYATEPWFHAALVRAGFAATDTVVYFRLNLLASSPPIAPPRAAVQLRPATLTDTHALAALDAEAFAPLWHFSAPEIIEMQVRGRVMVATVAGEPAGYAALLATAPRDAQREAHLARLAVHPRWQGQGVGRALLADAIHFAQQQQHTALTLNTQASNLRSQTLYRGVGFAPSGVQMPVLTLEIR